MRLSAAYLLFALAAGAPSAQTLSALGLDGAGWAEPTPAAELPAEGAAEPSAPPSADAVPALRVTRVEAGLRLERAGGGLPGGGGPTAAVIAVDRAGASWRLDVEHTARFGETGVVAGVGYARAFGRLRTAAFAGSSTAGLYHARLRTAGTVGVAVGARQQVVLSGTLAYVDARDVHEDWVGTVEVAAYAAPDLVAQLGAQLTHSDPGDAVGVAGVAAVTVGRPDARAVTARARYGNEAYLLVAAPDGSFPDTDVAFRSADAMLTWREPVTDALGVRLGAGVYVNPFYARTLLEAGLSWTFR